jgi:benzoyl-CoA reductase/2-hydroxyglutaryl-CoA dehydratase subunit BcrC/BadD/HgdB
MGMAFYADLDEALDIAQHLERTARDRFKQKQFVTSPEALRLYWVTPPADPLLLNHAEELGGQVVGSEYLINQIRKPLQEDLPPLEALAEGVLEMSLIGTSGQRADNVVAEAKRAKAEGVVISSIFAGSHCASENRIIAEEVRRRLKIPVLTFNVVGPGKERQQGQIISRMQAFMEVLQARRDRKRD